MPGKLGLHNFYAKDRRIRLHLPPTTEFNRHSFFKFMHRYASVFIKPNMSHMGKGIIKAWSAQKKVKVVKVKGATRTFNQLNSAYHAIRKLTTKDQYLIQKTIPLATYQSRPYDIRVMMMRNTRNQWQYAGMLAKVAGPSSVITNVNRGGGFALSIENALRTSLGLTSHEQLKVKRELVSLSDRICKRFDKYKYSTQIGIDFGIDEQRRIWVIEVNFDFPSHELFNKLQDKTMYRKIKSLRKSYLQSQHARARRNR